MIYYINFQPVFSRSGKFTGYNMTTTTRKNSCKEGWDQLSIEGSTAEFLRLRTMIKTTDPFAEDFIYFVDKHPLQIVDYLRGKTPVVKRDPDWKNKVSTWAINSKGEKV